MIRWPWQSWTDRDERLATAEKELRLSREERTESAKLAADLRQLRSENHITERIHRAMRGGEGQ